MSAVAATIFDRSYELRQKHLKLKALQPKTIEGFSRAIRRVGDYFDHQIDDLTEADLMDYFTDLREIVITATPPYSFTGTVAIPCRGRCAER